MIPFPRALATWPSPAFNDIMKAEIEALDAELLPLQQGLVHSSYANPDSVSPVILAVSETPGCLTVKVGLFYTGIIAGCSCADDPTPIDEINEYCEVLFEIDRNTAAATVTLTSA
jgi:hypothetical protein